MIPNPKETVVPCLSSGSSRCKVPIFTGPSDTKSQVTFRQLDRVWFTDLNNGDASKSRGSASSATNEFVALVVSDCAGGVNELSNNCRLCSFHGERRWKTFRWCGLPNERKSCNLIMNAISAAGVHRLSSIVSLLGTFAFPCALCPDIRRFPTRRPARWVKRMNVHEKKKCPNREPLNKCQNFWPFSWHC